MRVDMGTIVFLTIFISILCFLEINGRPQQTKPGCWYNARRYQEGQEVNTTEPCLRCRCNDGSLRCRLRMCSRLPSPAPSGCTTRIPRDNACCAELVCNESHERNVTAKRDPAKDMRRQDGGCLHEGVRYGPGSAMMGSQRCEYCFCISGSRRCLRPRCLLPLAGCIPLYAPYSCCPVAYNCSNSEQHAFSSDGAISSTTRNGCRVGDRSYVEGEMVRDVGWKGNCDNCFCAMGGIRCVPLSCAPPLQGCTPIVREGHCCPSTYNCSGTIEVKASQNYASYAFVSKDYAKFRKETNFLSINDHEIYDPTGNLTVEGRGHRNPQEKSQSPSTTLKTLIETTRTKTTNNSAFPIDLQTATLDEELLTPATNNSANTTDVDPDKIVITSNRDNETMDNEILGETRDTGKFSTHQETTYSTYPVINETTEISTIVDAITTNDLSVDQTTLKSDESLDFTNSILSREDSTEISILPSEISTTQLDDETTMDYSTPNDYTTESHQNKRFDSLPEVQERVKNVGIMSSEEKTTRRFVESTTKSLKINDLKDDYTESKKGSLEKLGTGESSVVSVKGPATGLPATILMPDNMLVINVTLRTNVSVGHIQGVTMNPVRSIPPDIEAILNITNRKKGEDYEYDYGQPTLPPSLPNVRIIPFVAADALVKQSEKASAQIANYPLRSVGLPGQENGPTVASGTAEKFYDIVTQQNRFSPPIETEGGFVPREPLFYDPPYRSSDHKPEIHAGATSVPADITNSHRKNDELAGICVFENRNYHHGDLLPSSGHCIICICYHGEVACSDEKCPPLKIGCQRLESDKICCGKIICVNAEESPTVVLDRADAIAPAPREPLPSLDGMVSPDPFRDVIKTEPAPDLPSLIEDMMPYLVEHRITKPFATPTTPMTPTDSGSRIPGHFQRRPDQKFIPEKPNDQAVSFVEDKPFASSEPNETIADSPSHKTSGLESSTIDSQESTMSYHQGSKEIPSIPHTIGSPPNDPGQLPAQEDDEESSIFSFGGVLDLLFSEHTDTQGTNEASNRLNKITPKAPANEPSNYQPNDVSHSQPNDLSNYRPSEPSKSQPNVPPNFFFNQPANFPPGKPLPSNFSPAIPSNSYPKAGPNVTSKVQPIVASDSSTGAILEKLLVDVRPDGEKFFDDSTMSSTSTVTGTVSAGRTTWIRVEEVERTTTMIPNIKDSWMDDSRRSTTGSLDNEMVTSVSSLLKLAGCNIYGRMYRVGRIITELSSPCLECRCTEVGVQCKQLEC